MKKFDELYTEVKNITNSDLLRYPHIVYEFLQALDWSARAVKDIEDYKDSINIILDADFDALTLDQLKTMTKFKIEALGIDRGKFIITLNK